ncbi:nitrate/sulfonate/bicarbonate ABC transporter ATP-binding protein [Paraburkholderia sp. MMS20-SJTR3]|uniref:Nitrate/sulfonate/bicarbonate ABC transporter ATP-binding protein n=1 Tax=Paraburkholderia sejongensis TaxID=2886946 RepID=A0ABS8JZI1_9BURK|nr:nitrate/sulfonate/bicarbonate ABC transporter ATP-binding protein [Paraburkholderia sp. MMS20-SJTR3]MCC8395317.1 nitrate/sulfonate/bicarbonate ABC transporter ATP-binding protein [Paraburkholderia sp. MMS20-SJTR3]
MQTTLHLNLAEPAQPRARVGTQVLNLEHVCRGFDKAQSELLVLDDVNLTLHEGEIVGLLGRSGSGKSTLLRIIAGLIRPTGGTVTYRGQPLAGPAEGVAMVFQTFALFPWLTVLQNVEAGLEAIGVGVDERRTRALAAIDLIGLDGFENAYPRELSGGMRQRVGFARALVVDPTILLMDEPFSALDVLTAETLRTDLLDLWNQERMPIKSVLIVTHNIEEAVFMCDRILVLSSNPGRVVAEIKVPFRHPRNRLEPAFRALVDDIYAKMTARPSGAAARRELEPGSRLPNVSTNLMAGLIETLAAAPYHGRADMPEIARTLRLEVDDLFPVAEMLQYLGFAEISEGDVILTQPARRFAEASTQERKLMFADHLLQNVPLAARIRKVLNERPGHRAPRVRFEQELADLLADSAAQETIDAVIDWGRYAEIFSYNDKTETFSLADVEN